VRTPPMGEGTLPDTGVALGRGRGGGVALAAMAVALAAAADSPSLLSSSHALLPFVVGAEAGARGGGLLWRMSRLGITTGKHDKKV
jgi:hypothetical protein